jgi:hypothetical protein
MLRPCFNLIQGANIRKSMKICHYVEMIYISCSNFGDIWGTSQESLLFPSHEETAKDEKK